MYLELSHILLYKYHEQQSQLQQEPEHEYGQLELFASIGDRFDAGCQTPPKKNTCEKQARANQTGNSFFK